MLQEVNQIEQQVVNEVNTSSGIRDVLSITDWGNASEAEWKELGRLATISLYGEYRHSAPPVYVEYGSEIVSWDRAAKGLCADRLQDDTYNYKLNSHDGTDEAISGEFAWELLSAYTAESVRNGWVSPVWCDDFDFDGNLKASRLAQMIGHSVIAQEKFKAGIAPKVVWEDPFPD